MPYAYEFSEDFRIKLSKISKKDKLLKERIDKKIIEIVDNPEHYKPLRNVMKGNRRVHVGSFVMLYEIKGSIIRFLDIEHHDIAYIR